MHEKRRRVIRQRPRNQCVLPAEKIIPSRQRCGVEDHLEIKHGRLIQSLGPWYHTRDGSFCGKKASPLNTSQHAHSIPTVLTSNEESGKCAKNSPVTSQATAKSAVGRYDSVSLLTEPDQRHWTHLQFQASLPVADVSQKSSLCGTWAMAQGSCSAAYESQKTTS